MIIKEIRKNIWAIITKFVSLICSFLWGSNVLKYFENMLKGLDVEIIEPVIFKGHPKKEDFEKIESLAEKILQKHKELKII